MNSWLFLICDCQTPINSRCWGWFREIGMFPLCVRTQIYARAGTETWLDSLKPAVRKKIIQIQQILGYSTSVSTAVPGRLLMFSRGCLGFALRSKPCWLRKAPGLGASALIFLFLDGLSHLPAREALKDFYFCKYILKKNLNISQGGGLAFTWMTGEWVGEKKGWDFSLWG